MCGELFTNPFLLLILALALILILIAITFLILILILAHLTPMLHHARPKPCPPSKYCMPS